MTCLVARLCLTLCDPVDCSLSGSSVHRISQERILECVAISFSMEDFYRQKGVEKGSNQRRMDCLWQGCLPLRDSRGLTGRLYSSAYQVIPGASLIAQLVKKPPAMQENLVQFLGQEDLLEKG